MLKKYDEHVLNEKKDVKAEKSAVETKINSLFSHKPVVSGSEKWPEAKGIYCLANIKKYVGGDNLKVDQIFTEMQKDKKIKSIKVKISAYNQTYPFYYHEDHTTKEEAEKYKETMEKSQKEVVKAPVKEEDKKKEVEKPKVTRKPREKKVAPTEGEARAKAKAVIKKKKEE